MSSPLLTPTPVRGKKQFFAVPTAIIDGTLRSPETAECFSDMTEDDWDFLVYAFSCIKGKSSEVYPGPTAAKKFCSIHRAVL